MPDVAVGHDRDRHDGGRQQRPGHHRRPEAPLEQPQVERGRQEDARGPTTTAGGTARRPRSSSCGTGSRTGCAGCTRATGSRASRRSGPRRTPGIRMYAWSRIVPQRTRLNAKYRAAGTASPSAEARRRPEEAPRGPSRAAPRAPGSRAGRRGRTGSASPTGSRDSAASPSSRPASHAGRRVSAHSSDAANSSTADTWAKYQADPPMATNQKHVPNAKTAVRASRSRTRRAPGPAGPARGTRGPPPAPPYSEL